MSFVRPEVRRALWRWREVLAGVGLLALGLWWGFGAIGWMINGLGYVLTAMAGALVVLGLQRGRFRDGADGPGVVQIVEGRVAYFGPLTGGAVDMADLSGGCIRRIGSSPSRATTRFTFPSPPRARTSCLTPSPACPACVPSTCCANSAAIRRAKS